MTPPRRLAADWVLTGIAPPIRGGAVLVDERGCISAVGTDVGGDVPHPPGVTTEYFPEAAIMPGFINAHTHLELTGLGDAIDAPDFPSWIRELRARKARRTFPEFLEAARQGIRECWAAGITTVADTGDTGAVAFALDELGGRGVAFQEVFGPHPDQVVDSMAGLKEAVARLRPLEREGRLRIGVSPHAPYTVSGPLYRAVGDWARQEKLPLAVHLAESAEESALLWDHSGGFAEAWNSRGIPPVQPQALSPVAFVDRHLDLTEVLCIHAIRVDADDIATLSRRRATVAHCPLSNRAHGHGDAPLKEILASGIHVGFGTDSVLSVGRLDLLAAARAARALGQLSAFDALGMLTWQAAGAIGFRNRLGMLVPGGLADLAIMTMPHAASEPEEQVLSGEGVVLATLVEGREVYRRAQ